MKKAIPLLALSALTVLAALAMPVPQAPAVADGAASVGAAEEAGPLLRPVLKCACICPEPNGSGGGVGFFPLPPSGSCSDLDGTPCTIFGQPSELTGCVLVKL